MEEHVKGSGYFSGTGKWDLSLNWGIRRWNWPGGQAWDQQLPWNPRKGNHSNGKGSKLAPESRLLKAENTPGELLGQLWEHKGAHWKNTPENHKVASVGTVQLWIFPNPWNQIEDCHLWGLPDPIHFVAVLSSHILGTIHSQCITQPCARALITQIYSHHILWLKSDAWSHWLTSANPTLQPELLEVPELHHSLCCTLAAPENRNRRARLHLNKADFSTLPKVSNAQKWPTLSFFFHITGKRLPLKHGQYEVWNRSMTDGLFLMCLLKDGVSIEQHHILLMPLCCVFLLGKIWQIRFRSFISCQYALKWACSRWLSSDWQIQGTEFIKSRAFKSVNGRQNFTTEIKLVLFQICMYTHSRGHKVVQKLLPKCYSCLTKWE